ncbi:hypothetical protein B0T20DRAFT_471461, partial [Sordaria brevicollis]
MRPSILPSPSICISILILVAFASTAAKAGIAPKVPEPRLHENRHDNRNATALAPPSSSTTFLESESTPSRGRASLEEFPLATCDHLPRTRSTSLNLSLSLSLRPSSSTVHPKSHPRTPLAPNDPTALRRRTPWPPPSRLPPSDVTPARSRTKDRSPRREPPARTPRSWRPFPTDQANNMQSSSPSLTTARRRSRKVNGRRKRSMLDLDHRTQTNQSIIPHIAKEETGSSGSGLSSGSSPAGGGGPKAGGKVGI